MERRRFPRSARLRSSREIRELFRTGRRRRCGPLDLVLGASTGARPRATVIVPRHGRRVVERNRMRRRLREVVRLHWLPAVRNTIPAPALIVRARAEAYEVSSEELKAKLLDCLGLPSC